MSSQRNSVIPSCQGPINPQACLTHATYHRALGSKVWSIDGVVWRQVGTSTVMTTPSATAHWISKDMLNSVFQVSGQLLAQFATVTETGRACSHFMLRDKEYGEHRLQRQFRQRLLRGRQQLSFRSQSWEELRRPAAVLLQSAAVQTRKKIGFIHDLWNQTCDLGASDPQYLIFGCFSDTKLIGYAIFRRFPGRYQAVDMICHPDFFARGAANLLLYESARALIMESDCQLVSFGRTSIPDTAGTRRIMRHAGIGEESIQVAFALHPKCAWLVKNKYGARIIHRLNRLKFMPESLRPPLEGLAVALETDLR